MSTPTLAYTVDGTCEATHVSRSKLYELWRAGNGPRFYTIGSRRYVTHESLIEWLRQRETSTGGAS
jgi:hypothetical protein